MLIADLTKRDGGTLRLGVVGSCRVHDPIKAQVRSGRGTFQWSAHNAFTHCPPEAIQHIAFCRDRLDIPRGFAPYILRQEAVPVLDNRLPELVETCDVFLVEMSSVDYLKCGRWYFNQDYFSQQFVRGGGLGVLNWFRNIGEAAPGEALVAEARASLEAAGRPVTASMEEILRTLRKNDLTQPDFTTGLTEVAYDRSRRWIFAPIFNVDGLSPLMAERRAELARTLKTSVEALGFDYFDPTPIVAGAGRPKALDGGGADHFHYAPDFLEEMGAAYLDVILPSGS
jgi:hypothetical protein